MIALVFPGQGSQQEQMALPWRDHPAMRRWAEASDLLGWDVAALGTDADAATLREPRNCQIALYVHHVVLLNAWREAGAEEPAAVAGHSLGEYNALVAAGVLDFADALRLVEVRASATQRAAEDAPGTMLACLGFEVAEVQAACTAAGAYVANDNAPGQIVVAGSSEALQRLRTALAEHTGKIRDVNVGAAYHSPHMRAAEAPLADALATAALADAEVPVIANVDAAAHSAAVDWPDLLRRQVVSPVRWRESVATLAQLGVQEVVELGASSVLTGMVKRIDRSLARRTVSAPEDL